ncbi:MAG: hypothetical protein WC492_02540 [Candidatus Micrarchaeia archaeon]
MALAFNIGTNFPKEQCNSCKNSFEKCQLGFEKCVFGAEAVSLLKNSKLKLWINLFAAKELINVSIIELKKPTPSPRLLGEYYTELLALSNPFTTEVEKINDKNMPDLSYYLRQQLSHHFNTTLTIASNSLYLVYKYNEAPSERLPYLLDLQSRLESFEFILKNFEKNPQLLNYLFDQMLPTSISGPISPSS